MGINSGFKGLRTEGWIDGQTDTTKLIVIFSPNFAKAPKN